MMAYGDDSNGVGSNVNLNTGSGNGVMGGLGSALGYGNSNVAGVNAGAYSNLRNNAQGAASSYNQQGAAAQGRQGPQINNQYGDQSRAGLNSLYAGEGGLANTLQGQINGTGPSIAGQQFQHATDQGIAAQMALANSSNGGAAARAGALRGAQQQGAQTQANASAQAGALRLQEQQGAEGQLANLYGQQGQQRLGQYGMENDLARAQAGYDLQNSAQNDQYSNALYGHSLQGQQLGLGAQQGYDQANLAAQQQAAAQQNAAAQGGSSLFGGILGAGEAALMSDENLKEGMHAAPDIADDFLRRMSPREYKYINPNDAPSNGGSYLGVTAQDLEKVRGVGHNLVQDTPRGKAVNQPATMSAVLAGLGRLHERMSAMEKGGRRG